MKRAGRAEPGARLARDPRRARPARRPADADPGADARRRRAAAARSCSPSSPRPASSRPARELVLREVARERSLGHAVPATLEIGAMLETPSLAFAPDALLPADRLHLDRRQRPQAVLLRRRPRERAGAPALRHARASASSSFLEAIVARCAAHGTPLSFCGEDAGRPVEALALAAIGFRQLSMRPASIGPVKALLRQIDLAEAREVIDAARAAGAASARPALEALLRRADFVV